MAKLKRTPKWAGDRIRREQIAEQRRANASGLAHRALFAGHRERTTRLVLEQAERRGGGSLCVLGAGNCLDLDLVSVASAFAEVHLVDIDRGAIDGARAWLPPAERERVTLHAPVDLSGVLGSLDRWQRGQATESELLSLPDRASCDILATLGRQFDVVLSSCLLTQLQLSVLSALTDRHQLFQGARLVVTLVHLRTLALLTTAGGTALLATDLASDDMYPLAQLPPDADVKPVMDQLAAAGNVIYVAHPGVLLDALRKDPLASRKLVPKPIQQTWLWQNGPEQLLLVYALQLDAPHERSANTPESQT